MVRALCEGFWNVAFVRVAFLTGLKMLAFGVFRVNA